MTDTPISTMMMRLVEKDPGVLDFDNMGAAEYEYGAPHEALGLLLCDPVIPVVDTETSFRMTGKDVSSCKPGAYSDNPRTRYERLSVRQYGDLEAIGDGRPMLLRHAPSLNDPKQLARFLAVTGPSLTRNVGGGLRRDTRAWLVIAPIVGLLYHPDRKPEIDAFVARITAVREKDLPSLRVRSATALEDALKTRHLGLVSADTVMGIRDRVWRGEAA